LKRFHDVLLAKASAPVWGVRSLSGLAKFQEEFRVRGFELAESRFHCCILTVIQGGAQAGD
jgi:hypothetical protein